MRHASSSVFKLVHFNFSMGIMVLVLAVAISVIFNLLFNLALRREERYLGSL